MISHTKLYPHIYSFELYNLLKMNINIAKESLKQAVSNAGYIADSLEVTNPKDPSHGDYSSSIALSLSKNYKESPMQIAEKIKTSYTSNPTFDSITVIAPGFINLSLGKASLLSSLVETRQAKNSALDGEKVMIEFTDPNPFKEFHIGHLYSNTIGESIVRLLSSQGAGVRRVCYQGDVGIHVACSVWGMTKALPNSDFKHMELDPIEKLGNYAKLSLGERIKWLGKCYAHGATAYKDHPHIAQEIKTLNAQIFLAAQNMHKRTKTNFNPIVDYESLIKNPNLAQDLVSKLYETGRAWTLEYFDSIYTRLGTKFDDFYFESEVGEYGYDIVKAHVTDGIFSESNGAVVFAGEQYGLHTRVLINSLGLPTYEAKELGLNPKKYSDFKFDRSIIVTANEINEYFKVVLKAMSLVAPTVAEKTTHLSHGLVKLPEGKMSSRTGKIISGEWLLMETKSRLSEIIDQNPKVEPQLKNEVIETLAVASIKYAFLRSSIGRDIVFDFDESLAFDGNSGPYLLYSIVRCKSILEKAPPMSVWDDAKSICNTDNSISQDDISILRILAKFDETVVVAADKLAPHILCTYLHSLAKSFSGYYERVNILKSENSLRPLRLKIVHKVMSTLTAGVDLLGFKTVGKM